MNNWTQFTYGLAAIYFFYYLLNLLYDLLISSKGARQHKNGPLILEVAEEVTPLDASLEAEIPVYPQDSSQGFLSSGPLDTTGGRRFEDIMLGALKDSELFSSQIRS